ncbi:hypothetical protein [Klebsiella quasipneumoniae]|uniref:hypothetical protein n=1 Tax=Klebsiella quasipneumoniae TaxID=1463165 RepID=UPI0018C5DF2B|nr:hypothetical protein [Klebsiella quasipneumoniae]
MRYEFSGLQAATLKILLADMGFEYQRRWFISQKRVRHITKTRQCGADQQRLSAYSALQQGSTILNLPEIEAEFSKEDFNMLFSAIWPQENSEVAK